MGNMSQMFCRPRGDLSKSKASRCVFEATVNKSTALKGQDTSIYWEVFGLYRDETERFIGIPKLNFVKKVWKDESELK